eukprot:6328267-Pyramimonas_sp.AAC.1
MMTTKRDLISMSEHRQALGTYSMACTDLTHKRETNRRKSPRAVNTPVALVFMQSHISAARIFECASPGTPWRPSMAPNPPVRCWYTARASGP